MIIDTIDAVLTVLFWLPAKLIGYEKCSKCTIRVRARQGLLFVTAPAEWPLIRRLPGSARIARGRTDWYSAINAVPALHHLRRIAIGDDNDVDVRAQ